jgi:Rieske Fe-S protein
MACRNCDLRSRREFLEWTLALIGAGTLGACGSDILTTPAITTFTVQVANFPSLAAVGGIAVVGTGSPSGEPIAVVRTGATTFLALSLICPHSGVTVGLSSPGFLCPGHGATFAADGTWTGGQHTTSLGRYNLSYDPTTGTLQIG